MHGLAKGEQSTATNPVLFLIGRTGGFLADIVSGTYKIEDISDPSVVPVEKVAEANFNIALVADGGHKLGTGRFYIPSGATADWDYGTHRVICTYKMSATGRDFTQIIEFEVLDPVEYLSGASYVGYASTRWLEQELIATAYTPQQLHPKIAQASRLIEAACERFFGPRYVTLVLDGVLQRVLSLNESIIAIEKLESVSKDETGAETSYEWNQYLYKVYNRHLDGLRSPDDRQDPMIELVASDDVILNASDFTWPYGQQNIQLTGVFGYTEPEYDPANVEAAIGHVPKELARVVGALVHRRLEDPTLSDPTASNPGRVRSEKTRHQAVSFFGSSGVGNLNGSLTGDPMLDAILVKYVRPLNVGYAKRRYRSYGV